MAGFDEGIAAFLQGFASMFAPAAAQSTALQRQAQEAEKDRQARRSERAADKEERDAARTEDKFRWETMLTERRTERKDDRKDTLDKEARARDFWFMGQGLERGAEDRRNEQAVKMLKETYGLNEKVARYQNQLAEVRGFQEDSRRRAERESDFNRADKIREEGKTWDLKLRSIQRFDQLSGELRKRQWELIDRLPQLDRESRIQVSATTERMLGKMLDIAERVAQTTGRVPDIDAIKRDADKFTDFVVARTLPDISKHMTEEEGDALATMMATFDSAKTPDEMEAAVQKFRSAPNASEIYKRAESRRSGDDKKKPPPPPSRIEEATKALISQKGLPEGEGSQDLARGILAEQGMANVSYRGKEVNFKPNYEAYPENKEYQGRGWEFDKWAEQNPKEFERLVDLYGSTHDIKGKDLTAVAEEAKLGVIGLAMYGPKQGVRSQVERFTETMERWKKSGSPIRVAETGRPRERRGN